MTKYRVFPEDNSNPNQEGDEKADDKVIVAPSVGPSIVAATISTPISTIPAQSSILEMGLGATQNALNTSSIHPATKTPLKSTIFTKFKGGILKSNAMNRNESKRDVSAYSNSSVPATNISLNPSVIVNIPVSSPVLNPKIADTVDTEAEEPFWLFKDDLGPELEVFRTINAPETGMNSTMVTSRISAPLSLFHDWLFPKNEKQEKKEVEMSEMGKAALDPQASKVPFNNLEEEIKLFLPQIHVVRLLDRFVLFHREEEANLFKEIRKYQKKIPSATRTDAFETFGILK